MELKIAAVPQGSLHKYWKAMQAGAEKAVRELQGQGVTVNFMWKAPLREDDRQEQTKILESVLRQQVDGIILAPFDSRTFRGAPIATIVGGRVVYRREAAASAK